MIFTLIGRTTVKRIRLMILSEQVPEQSNCSSKFGYVCAILNATLSEIGDSWRFKSFQASPKTVNDRIWSDDH